MSIHGKPFAVKSETSIFFHNIRRKTFGAQKMPKFTNVLSLKCLVPYGMHLAVPLVYDMSSCQTYY